MVLLGVVVCSVLWSCANLPPDNRLRGIWTTGIMATDWGRAEHRLVFRDHGDVELVSHYVDAGGSQTDRGKRAPLRGISNGFTVLFESPELAEFNCVLSDDGRTIRVDTGHEQFVFHKVQ